MKKFLVVISAFFILSIVSIVSISSKENVYLEVTHDPLNIEVQKVKPFEITKEKWPEDLIWEDGSNGEVFASDKAVKGGTWHSEITSFPPNFRQVGPDSNSSFRAVLDVNDMSLVDIHPNTDELLPSLAKRWAIGKDKKTVYYELDEDAKWDDGKPIIADDYVFTIKFMRTPGIIAPWYNQYFSTMFDEVLKFSDYRIAVRMTQPLADIVSQTAIRPYPYHYYGGLRIVNKKYTLSTAIAYLKRDKKEVPEEFIELQEKFQKETKVFQEKLGDLKKEIAKETEDPEKSAEILKEKMAAAKLTEPEEPSVEIEVEDVELDWVRKNNWKVQPRTGAYNIHTYIKGKEVVLKRNENWWAKNKKYYKNRYNVDYIKYTVLRDSHIAFEHFLKARLDQYPLVLPNYWHSKGKYLEAVDKGYMSKVWFYTDSPQPSYRMTFNMDHPELAKKDVRLGITYALNIQEMLDTVLRGDYERAETFNEGYGKYTNRNIKARRFDLDKAIKYFVAAGYDKVGSDGIRVNKEGKRLSFKILYSRADHTERILVLVNEAKKAGLEFKLDQFDSTAVFKAMLNKQHEIAWTGWGQMSRPTYRSGFHKDEAHRKKTNNLSNLDDDEISKMIDEYRMSIDSETRIGLAHKIEERLFELLPSVPTYKVPYFRQAVWRWVKFPEHIGVKKSEMIMDDYGLFWIDEEEKSKVLKAMSKGEIFYDVEKLIKDERYRAGNGK